VRVCFINTEKSREVFLKQRDGGTEIIEEQRWELSFDNWGGAVMEPETSSFPWASRVKFQCGACHAANKLQRKRRKQGKQRGGFTMSAENMRYLQNATSVPEVTIYA